MLYLEGTGTFPDLLFEPHLQKQDFSNTTAAAKNTTYAADSANKSSVE